jgi:hypothetical protein
VVGREKAVCGSARGDLHTDAVGRAKEGRGTGDWQSKRRSTALVHVDRHVAARARLLAARDVHALIEIVAFT